MAATEVTLNDLEGHSKVADLFKCNPSNICAAFYTTSTDSVLAWLLCISRASCFTCNNGLKHTLSNDLQQCHDNRSSIQCAQLSP